MVSWWALVALLGAERLVELRVAKRNEAWSRAQGAEEHGAGHYPWMVGLHSAFLVGLTAEPLLADRPWTPAFYLPFGALALLAQGLRWWCITTLGPRWNTRVLVIPGLPPVRGGPYRWLRHPNYLAVVVEGVAMPMMHGLWLTAAGFTVLNAALLATRLRVENDALRRLG